MNDKYTLAEIIRGVGIVVIAFTLIAIGLTI